MSELQIVSIITSLNQSKVKDAKPGPAPRKAKAPTLNELVERKTKKLGRPLTNSELFELL